MSKNCQNMASSTVVEVLMSIDGVQLKPRRTLVCQYKESGAEME